jgi:2-polyprenyl-3-methyl-5-hydroxy-6-metoxy-1,4-benzoquinol methylase
MKNLLNEKPTDELHGRLAFSRDFVDLGSLRGQDILDIGCGYGWFENLSLMHGAASVTGIEPTDADLVTVRKGVRDERASFRVASATALPFDDGSFDAVVMWEVLEHLPKGSEAVAFSEIARVLRPGGRLFLSTPHATLLTQATDPARWLIGHRHYGLDAVRRLTESAGLEVVRLETRGGPWEIAHMNVLYFSKWILRRRPLFERRLISRSDRDWSRPGGFVHVFLEATKPA